MLTLFISSAASYKIFNLDCHTYFDGNWTTNITGTPEYAPVSITEYEDENKTIPNQFKGSFRDVSFTIDVVSNTSIKLNVWDWSIPIEFTKKASDGVAYSDVKLPNNKILSVTINQGNSFEFAIVSPEDKEIMVFGWHKDIKFEYKLKDFLIPTCIAAVVMIIGKKVLGNISM